LPTIRYARRIGSDRVMCLSPAEHALLHVDSSTGSEQRRFALPHTLDDNCNIEALPGGGLFVFSRPQGRYFEVQGDGTVSPAACSRRLVMANRLRNGNVVQVDYLGNIAVARELDSHGRMLLEFRPEGELASVQPCFELIRLGFSGEPLAKDDGELEHWVELLKTGNIRERCAVLQELGNMGPRARPAVGTVIHQLRAEDPTLRRRAVDALAHIGPSAMSDMRDALKHQDANVRAGAAVVIGSYREQGKAAIQDLVRTADDAETSVRASCALALGNIGAERDQIAPTLVLVRLLGDRSADVRYAAAGAFERIATQEPQAVHALLQALRDDDSRVRLYASYALGHVRSQPDLVVPEIVQILEKDDDLAVRRAAAWSLGLIGPNAESAVPHLTRLLSGPMPELSDSAVELRRTIVHSMGLICPHSASAISALQIVLSDPSADALTRREAAQALGNIGPSAAPALASLRAMSSDNDPDVRRAVQGALRKIVAPGPPKQQEP